MLKRYLSILTIFSMILMLTACSDSDDDSPKPTVLQITSEVNTLPVGLTTRLQADLFYDDGSTLNNVQASWQSMNTDIATIDANSGVITGISQGNSLIKATVNGVTGEATAIIVDAALTSLMLKPGSFNIPLGLTDNFEVEGGYSDGSTHDLTGNSDIIWNSSAAGIVSFDDQGIITALSKGETKVTASVGDIQSSGGNIITVTDGVIVNFTISPDVISKPKGLTQQFIATAYLSDNSERDITSEVDWVSENPDVISSLGDGVFKGIAINEGQISATLNDSISSDNKPVFSVTRALLTSFDVEGPNSQPLGKSVQFKANATFSDGNEYDVSGDKQVFWQSSDTKVATVTLSGKVKGISEGQVTISALTSFSNAQSSKTITISPKEIESIHIRSLSDNLILSEGSEQPMDAIGRYTDGTIEDNIEQDPYFSWETKDKDQNISQLSDLFYMPSSRINEDGIFKYDSNGTIPGFSSINAQYKKSDDQPPMVSNTIDLLLALPEKISSGSVDFLGNISEFEAIILNTEYSSTVIQELQHINDNQPYTFVLMTYFQAKAHCENLVYNSNNDWRLPTSAELMALWSNEDGTDDANNFNKGWIFTHNYWSDTQVGSQFKSVSLTSGDAADTDISENLLVSCVRER